MTIRVLVVDDSSFFCNRVRKILEEDPELRVVGIAYNGQQAVELNKSLRPDVITMDIEMPLMDGISAVKSIMGSQPCPILMLSAMTQVGAKASLDALNAGAIDFFPKQFEEIDANRESAMSQLRHRIKMVASQTRHFASAKTPGLTRKNFDLSTYRSSSNHADPDPARIDLLVIAASTGGPVAIQQILSNISANCRFPILLLQHMPQNFTKSFAERLDQLCKIKVKEAENGDIIQAGTAYLAPGGMQMILQNASGQSQISIKPKQAGEIYSPSIDMTFSSVAEYFPGQILAVVLTGMGSDGKEGAVKLKQRGAQIWAQDESTSIIYGMPKAIAEAQLASKIYSLDEIAQMFKKFN